METIDFLHVSLGLIEPSPTNPRKYFDEAKLAELAKSVGKHGVLQPILVRPWPAEYPSQRETRPTYELIAGERRYRAALLAKRETIPVTVRELDDREVLEIQVIENLQREGLTELEEAEGYALMMRDYGYTADELADKIGKSRAYIYGRLKLTALCEAGRKEMRAGRLVASVALLIARIPGAALQERAINEVLNGHTGEMSARVAAKHIQSKYCLDLKTAPFPASFAQIVLRENTVIGKAGDVFNHLSCTDCPSRSGNAPETSADIESADVCTDPDCFADKRAAWGLHLKAEAIARGQTVVVGNEAKKADIAYSHTHYIPVTTKKYDMDGQPTFGQIAEKAGIQPVLVLNTRTGDYVEAVPAQATKAAIQAQGGPTDHDHRANERELERQVRAENAYRQALFAAVHAARRDSLANMLRPDLGEPELRLIAHQFWCCLWRASQEKVAPLWVPQSDKKDHYARANAMIGAVSEQIKLHMDREQLLRLMLDCALVGQASVSIGTLTAPVDKLEDQARDLGIEPQDIRARVEAERAEKRAQSAPAKTISTPSKAAAGEGVDPVQGDTVRILVKDQDVNFSGNVGTVLSTETCPLSGITSFEIDVDGQTLEFFRDEIEKHETTPTPSDAARAAGGNGDEAGQGEAPTGQPAGEIEMNETPTAAAGATHKTAALYAHPESKALTWSGRGRQPKWVEEWIAGGGTLDQLRVPAGQASKNSAPRGANAKPCAIELPARCTKTVELPL